MKVLILILVALLSLPALCDSDKENHKDKKKSEKHPKALAIFDVIPLNSPVKGSIARFLLQVPVGFAIDEVKFKVRNAGRIFEKVSDHKKINLIDGPQGKELQISVSKLPPGFYQLFVKVKDQKRKEHEYKNKYKDHVMFVVDESLQVPMPNATINDKTVAGVDSDGDGIRDDIQRWINEKYATQPKVKMTMKQMAMGMQLALLSVANKEQSIVTSKKYLNDLTCAFYTVGVDAAAKLKRELKSKILNTKDRHYADIKVSANFSGQSHDLPSTPEEEKALCAFNPDSL